MESEEENKSNGKQEGLDFNIKRSKSRPFVMLYTRDLVCPYFPGVQQQDSYCQSWVLYILIEICLNPFEKTTDIVKKLLEINYEKRKLLIDKISVALHDFNNESKNQNIEKLKEIKNIMISYDKEKNADDNDVPYKEMKLDDFYEEDEDDHYYEDELYQEDENDKLFRRYLE